jgi:hypothetical protein
VTNDLLFDAEDGRPGAVERGESQLLSDWQDQLRGLSEYAASARLC